MQPSIVGDNLDLEADAKETIMTVGDELIQQGEQQGAARGFLQGRRVTLRNLLQQRFGDQISADVERRVTTASAEQVTAWVKRVMSAATLTELLTD